MAPVTLLETRALTRRFGGLTAVDAVDFTLPQGEIRALIGPNGAGKTTFVSLICGRLPPTSGTIAFNGQDITRLPAQTRVRLGIAYTFQITSIYARLPVWDNVALAVQSRRTPDLAAATEAALTRVGLADRALGQPTGGDRPVLDKTGLTGRYDFVLKTRLDQGTRSTTGPDGESFFTTIEEQLGLKLESQKVPLEILVIDSVTRPSEN
jgi:ABC-type sugar transport system ATPase subunit